MFHRRQALAAASGLTVAAVLAACQASTGPTGSPDPEPGIRLPQGALVRSVTTYSLGAAASAAARAAQCLAGQPRGAPKSSPSGRRPAPSPSG